MIVFTVTHRRIAIVVEACNKLKNIPESVDGVGMHLERSHSFI